MNNLQNLFNDVVEDEAEENNLDPQNKVVPSIHVAQELAFGHDDSISHFILSFSDMKLNIEKIDNENDNENL